MFRVDLECRLSPSEKAEISKSRLERCSTDMGPVEHLSELRGVLHVSLECREENVGSVGEDDDSKRDGKGLEVKGEGDFGETPVTDAAETVGNDDEIDEEMGHGAPETESRHGVEVSEECTRKKNHSAEHHPRALVYRRAWKRP